MKKILYPTDFSTHSTDVLHYALELAKKMNARIVAMHAYGRPEFSASGEPKPINQAEQMLEVLHQFVEEQKGEKYRAVEMEYLVEVGFPAAAILNVVADEAIDLIVMGMASKDDVARNIFGSVARDVLKKVDCPILVIPTNFRYKKPKKIAYTTNFLFKDIQALNTLKKWATIFDSEINCLHIVSLKEEIPAAKNNMNILEEGFGNHQFTQFDIVQGNLITAINEYAAEEQVEMIAMLSRKRNLIQRMIEGSNAQRLAKQVDVPLLVLKGAAFAPTKWETVVDEEPAPLWERD